MGHHGLVWMGGGSNEKLVAGAAIRVVRNLSISEARTSLGDQERMPGQSCTLSFSCERSWFDQITKSQVKGPAAA